VAHVAVTVVPRERTPLSDDALRDAAAAGHVRAFGVPPSEARLSVAWAMLALEHAHGEALWCNNFGNVDAGAGWQGAAFALTATEGSGATAHPETKLLRAFPDAVAGACGWWHFLEEHDASALVAFDAGDGVGAAIALKARGYYTGDLGAYERALRSLVAEYARRWPTG
jgi:hypothetical protein